MPISFASTWTDPQLQSLRQACDPLADACIEALVAEQGPHEARRLFDVLIHNIELDHSRLPRAVVDFVQQQNHLPDWADPTLIRQAEQLYLDHGPKFLLFFFFRSLPTLYVCAHGAKVLIHTGRLTERHAAQTQFQRRIGETAQFVSMVMERDALGGAAGVARLAALKIRLIHAAIRHFIPAERWDTASWGQPINQEDLLITLLTFGITPLQCMEQIGLALGPAEEKAWWHFWQVMGVLLGVVPEQIPADPQSARQLMAQILQRQAAPSEAGRTLAHALIQYVEQHNPNRQMKKIARLMMRNLCPDDIVEMLGVAPPQKTLLMRLMPYVFWRYLGLVERLEDMVPAGTSGAALIEQISRKFIYNMVGYFGSYKRDKVALSPEMRRAWKI